VIVRTNAAAANPSCTVSGVVTICPGSASSGFALAAAGSDGTITAPNGGAGPVLTVNADGTLMIATSGTNAYGILVSGTGGNAPPEATLLRSRRFRRAALPAASRSSRPVPAVTAVR
jgi:hypothetical protein